MLMTKHNQTLQYFEHISAHEVVVALVLAYFFKQDNPMSFFSVTPKELSAQKKVTQKLAISEKGDIYQAEDDCSDFNIDLTISITELKKMITFLYFKQPELTEKKVEALIFDAIIIQILKQIWGSASYYKYRCDQSKRNLIRKMVSFCEQGDFEPIAFYEKLLIPFVAKNISHEKMLMH